MAELPILVRFSPKRLDRSREEVTRLPVDGVLRLEFGKGGFKTCVTVGTSPKCNIVLEGSDASAEWLYLFAASNHRYVEAIVEGVRVNGELLTPHRPERVDDAPVSVGDFELSFYDRYGQLEKAGTKGPVPPPLAPFRVGSRDLMAHPRGDAFARP